MSDIPYPTIKAKIIADSVPYDNRFPLLLHARRLVTFELTYPRYIHAEIMTHRVFSRNAQSSRAIPVKRRLERVRKDPVMPIRWGANQRGMQARDDTVERPEKCRAIWELAASDAANAAEDLMTQGLHKQWANRLLEPFDTITTIVTSSDWGNFFGLRCHPDAQPEFQNLAWKMADLYFNSFPTNLGPGAWHLPYVSSNELVDAIGPSDATTREDVEHAYGVLLKASVARCARVSYLNHDGSDPDIEKDVALHDRLLADGHMSPFEHQARPATATTDLTSWGGPIGCGNFGKGWVQYRKTLGPRELRRFSYQEAVERGDRPWDRPYTGED